MSAQATSVVNLGTRLQQSSKDLHKYLWGGAGRRLLFEHESRFGIDGRLPQHYRDYFLTWKQKPQAWIHLRPKEGRFEKDQFGQTVRVHNANLPVLYPVPFHHGLWGGEGVFKGLLHPIETKHFSYNQPRPRYWWPKLHQTVVYSEVLNAHIAMEATDRGEHLVDEHGGFDMYLLQSPVNEVYSIRLLQIKREILLALARPDERLWPDNPRKRTEVMDKYGEYALPEDEADWHGLPIALARDKQMALERLQELNSIQPAKVKYRQELVDLLRQGYLDDIDPQLIYEKEDVGEGTLASAVKGIKSLGSKLPWGGGGHGDKKK